MTTDQLLKTLQDQGITVIAEQGRLRLKARRGGLPQSLLQEIKRHKAALLALLDKAPVTLPTEQAAPWQDPRPDLVEDHIRWTALLARAYHLDGRDPNGAFGALYGARCCGARLVIDGPAGWRLDERGPWPNWRIVARAKTEMRPAKWQRLRHKWLLPHKDVIIPLLRSSDINSKKHC